MPIALLISDNLCHQSLSNLYADVAENVGVFALEDSKLLLVLVLLSLLLVLVLLSMQVLMLSSLQVQE
jgi:hypothetical protein